jgi:hypothetical protein
MRRANDQIRSADTQNADAFRKCQKRREKATQDGDPEGAADALRAFNKARAAAGNKAATARAKLTKRRD